MTIQPIRTAFARCFLSLLVITTLLGSTTPLALANDKAYKVELVVTSGKKTVETDAVLNFTEDSFEVVPNKKTFGTESRKMVYSEVSRADYSYAKKPMLSAGGAVVSAIFIGLLVVPFLFIKKKRHWISVQSGDQFAVIKLGNDNFRPIIAEFETRGVKITTVAEEK